MKILNNICLFVCLFSENIKKGVKNQTFSNENFRFCCGKNLYMLHWRVFVIVLFFFFRKKK